MIVNELVRSCTRNLQDLPRGKIYAGCGCTTVQPCLSDTIPSLEKMLKSDLRHLFDSGVDLARAMLAAEVLYCLSLLWRSIPEAPRSNA